MITRRNWLAGSVATVALLLAWSHRPKADAPAMGQDADWRRRLTPEQYRILREAGTEAPFTSPLLNEHRAGTFGCAGCGRGLFASHTKFDSGTGWPSFWAPLEGAVSTRNDDSLGMERTEVRCGGCDGHLGHVFADGPPPTGQRFCMNGVALVFHAA